MTNPPIDPIREEMVMSLQCPVGPESNLLEATPQHCARMVVELPILSLEEMQALKDSSYRFSIQLMNNSLFINFILMNNYV